MPAIGGSRRHGYCLTMKNSHARSRIAIGITLLALLLAWWLIPGVHGFMQRSLAAFATLDQQAVERFIDSWPAGGAGLLRADDSAGDYRPASRLSDHLCQRLPVRGFLGRRAVVGKRHGRGGAVLFIARALGRDAVEKLTGKSVLQSMDGFFTRYGKHTLLICRLLPFVPFDPVSYAAGLTSMRFRHFMLATGLGQLPATIVYSWTGSLLTGGTFWLVTGLSILFALAIVVAVAKALYLEQQKRRSR